MKFKLSFCTILLYAFGNRQSVQHQLYSMMTAGGVTHPRTAQAEGQTARPLCPPADELIGLATHWGYGDNPSLPNCRPASFKTIPQGRKHVRNG